MSWENGKFTSKEFECKCGCGLDKVSPTYLWKLNLSRDYSGFSYIISSGCRCEQHNKDEGGSLYSDHLGLPACEGADIKVETSQQRFIIVDSSLKAGFRRIGIAKTFIHLGDRQNNPQKVLWVY